MDEDHHPPPTGDPRRAISRLSPQHRASRGRRHHPRALVVNPSFPGHQPPRTRSGSRPSASPARGPKPRWRQRHTGLGSSPSGSVHTPHRTVYTHARVACTQRRAVCTQARTACTRTLSACTHPSGGCTARLAACTPAPAVCTARLARYSRVEWGGALKSAVGSVDGFCQRESIRPPGAGLPRARLETRHAPRCTPPVRW